MIKGTYKHSEEAKEKIRESNRRRLISNETKIRMSLAKKGKPNHPQTEETKQKIGDANRGDKNPNFGKKISQYHREKVIKSNHSRIISFKTRKKISDSHKGSLSHLWKGGISKINKLERKRFEIQLWKRACMERDNFTCAKTGQRGGRLVVHHISNFAGFPELRTSIGNGITLSVESHLAFHKKYGYNDNNREQLEEFLGYSL